MAGFRVKDTSRSLCYPVYVVIVFHLVKQSAKPLGFLLFFFVFVLLFYRLSANTVQFSQIATEVVSPCVQHCGNQI